MRPAIRKKGERNDKERSIAGNLGQQQLAGEQFELARFRKDG